MSLSLYEPFYDFDRFFSDWFAPEYAPERRGRGGRGREGEAGPRTLRPAYVLHSMFRVEEAHCDDDSMDLHDDPKSNTVTAALELPGVKKEDINIDITNNRLTISAEVKKDEEREESGYAIRERRYGRFQRTLQLPEGVKACHFPLFNKNTV
jgi:hypothetical protein